MSTVVKFPTTTTTIVSGWTNPTNAYAEDGVNTYSSTDDAEQKYGGWNFTTADIPAGAQITKVEMGAKHYEDTDWYTSLKYVTSAGSSYTYQLTARTTLTWDWVDITSLESAWDLTKLNNADVRIISTYAPPPGGCIPPDAAILMWDKSLKPAKEIKVGDEVVAGVDEKGNLVKGRVTAVTHHISEKPILLIAFFESPGRDIAVAPQHKLNVFHEKRWKLLTADEISRLKPPIMLAGLDEQTFKPMPRIINEVRVIKLHEVYNIQVDKGYFYAGYVHVHNLIKVTCYVDAVALRVTYTVGILRRTGEALTQTVAVT
jgi:hypothetical protein